MVRHIHGCPVYLRVLQSALDVAMDACVSNISNAMTVVKEHGVSGELRTIGVDLVNMRVRLAIADAERFGNVRCTKCNGSPNLFFSNMTVDASPSLSSRPAYITWIRVCCVLKAVFFPSMGFTKG